MLPGKPAGKGVAREKFRKKHEFGLPQAEDNPIEKTGRGTADRDDGLVALAKARAGGGEWSVGCVHRCESVKKGVATGGAGDEPAAQKLWPWGTATYFNTCSR